MKVQEVISSCIMFIVSGLVLVGFTIAWYTNTHMPAVTGMELHAVEVGHIKVSLTPGGKDVSRLTEGERYAEVHIMESPGAEEQAGVPVELAPGAHGRVTFYISPVNNSDVKACDIEPILWISQDGSTWHPGERIGDEAAGTAGEALEELYEIAGKHIAFFSDADEKNVISADEPYHFELQEAAAGVTSAGEKYWTVTIYFKWYYEYYEGYPLSEEEKAVYTTRQALLDKYDEEDMLLGNHISHMKFYFTFAAR